MGQESGNDKAAVEVSARAAVLSEAQLGKDLLLNSCGWQNSVACGLLGCGPQFLAVSRRFPSRGCLHRQLTTGQLTFSKAARERNL